MGTTTSNFVGVGVVQFHATPGNRDRNLSAAEEQLRAMATQGLGIAVLPELFSNGYDLAADLNEQAEEFDGPTVTALTLLAADLDIAIATTVLCRTDCGDLINCAMVIDETGIVASAAKTRLWDNERTKFAAGNGEFAVARTVHGTVGVAACYEAGFPEAVRALALQGAEIIAMPSAFGRQRLHAWDLMTRSRALENGCFVAAAGMCGENPSGKQFAGTSRVVDPRGNVLLELGVQDDYGVITVDLAEISRARAEIPYLQDFNLDQALVKP